jgi:hypothetical protein
MIAFRITLNGRRIVTAGLPGQHVLSAIATSVVRAPEVAKLARPRRLGARELQFELGGLWTAPDGAKEHVSWTNVLPLKRGDKLSIEVLETERVDDPTRRERSEAPSIEAAEKRHLRYLKKKYPESSKSGGERRQKRPSQKPGASRRR